MRILFTGVIVVFLGAAYAGGAPGAERYVTPAKSEIPVFAHDPIDTSEQPVFIANFGEWLMVLESSADAYKVSDMKGEIGWIPKSRVRQSAAGEDLSFNDVNVLAYLDNPTPVYILDASNALDKSILLDRSFSAELMDNIDWMTVERIVGEAEAR
ncbi:MAG TPA: hypothetical protein VLX68_09645 [Chitinivibrionales bacterium]|nr:hypothetical protein [Chitinivibrionales bacterium]